MPAFDGGDDAIWGFGPDEGLGRYVVFGNEAVYGGLQLDDRAEYAAFEPSFGQLSEEPLHGVEPGARRRCEVEPPSRVTIEPGQHLRVLVSGIIVENGVDDLARRHLRFDGVEEADEFLMTVTLHIPPSDGSIENVERGKKRCRAMPLIIVRHGSAAPLLQRQSRLGAVERLDLALFVHGQNKRMRGRRQVKPDNIPKLFDKLRVLGELELA